jgi:hypothetical protein
MAQDEAVIQIRRGSDSDKPEILARIEEVFGDRPAQRAERLWNWQWHRDPRLPFPGYNGIVAEWRGHIIANLSLIPAGLHVAGEPVQAWWFVDVLVHWGLTRQALREHKRTARGLGPDLTRGIASALFDHPDAGPIQLGKHISGPMSTIGSRIGFEIHADSGSFYRRVSLRHALGRVLGATVGDLAGAVTDLFLPAIPGMRLPVMPLAGPFDARFDTLWAAIKGGYPAICRRDSAVLNWRYRQHPDEDYFALTVEENGALRGYCVIKVFDQHRRRRGKIVDLLTMPGDEAAARALLAGALRELRRQRAERAECFTSLATLASILGDFGFTPRLSRSQRAQVLMTRRLPESARGIYVTQGDGDGG